MQIKIDTLEGNTITVELSDVGIVQKDDDIIYFNSIPCLLSSARPSSINPIFPGDEAKLS